MFIFIVEITFDESDPKQVDENFNLTWNQNITFHLFICVMVKYLEVFIVYSHFRFTPSKAK